MTGEASDRWPLDLTIFAALCVIWAAILIVRVFAQSGLGHVDDSMQAVIFGYKFYGMNARFVLLFQSVIYSWFGMGIWKQRRSALVVAILYMLQVVIGHLVFILTNLGVPGQEVHVKIAGLEGPLMVLILLYLWIRSRGLIFEEGASA